MADRKKQLLLKRLGYSFKDPALFDLALSHCSVGRNNNERLEFLGDSLLGCFITPTLFHQFPHAKEGQLSRLRSQLVKGETLAEIAREFELGDSLNLGEGEIKSGGHRRDSILADAVEAIIGAIYLDSDFEQCRVCVLSWFETRLTNLDLDAPSKDAKTQLQELLQGKGLPLPDYELNKTTGQDHSQVFTVSCHITSLSKPVIAQASSRRKAEKLAAAQALDLLKNNG